MDSAKSKVETFMKELCTAAKKYGILGEKPIAVIAALKYVNDNRIVGKCLLEIFSTHTHIHGIKSVFLDLAYGYSNLKNPNDSWNNVITELPYTIRKDSGIDVAFSELAMKDVQSLYEKYMTILEKSSMENPKTPTITPQPGPHEALETIDYGNFYLLIRNFERSVRNFIVDELVNKFDKGWTKNLENAIPDMVKRWIDRKNLDEKWGIDPEENLINYADTTDYMQIIEKYSKIFSEGPDELGDVKANLKIFALRGRNPVMHCRNLTQVGYFSAQGAEQFLRKWMERMRGTKLHAK
jgi:hypothetical protein